MANMLCQSPISVTSFGGMGVTFVRGVSFCVFVGGAGAENTLT